MDPDADPDDVPAFRVPRQPLNAYQLWQLGKERRELRKSLLDRWQATASQTGTGRPIDALICPVAPYAAVPHGQTRYVTELSSSLLHVNSQCAQNDEVFDLYHHMEHGRLP